MRTPEDSKGVISWYRVTQSFKPNHLFFVNIQFANFAERWLGPSLALIIISFRS